MAGPRRLGGLYLVISPALLPTKELLDATKKALEGGVDLLQLSASQQKNQPKSLAKGLSKLAQEYEKPFLLNNDLQFVKETNVDGVHFDNYEITPHDARRWVGKECIVGYTVNTDLEKVRWAEKEGADYVSFCSVFSKCTATQCPTVPLETVKKAKALTALPVFAAGGINLNNIQKVLETGADGVAVTSAILNAEDPEIAAKEFKKAIREH